MAMHLSQGEEEWNEDKHIPAFLLPETVKVDTTCLAWIPDIQPDYVAPPITIVGPSVACCILFQKGKCEKGAECSFRHEKIVSRHEIMDLADSEEGLKSGVNQEQPVHDLAEKLNSNL